MPNIPSHVQLTHCSLVAALLYLDCRYSRAQGVPAQQSTEAASRMSPRLIAQSFTDATLAVSTRCTPRSHGRHAVPTADAGDWQKGVSAVALRTVVSHLFSLCCRAPASNRPSRRTPSSKSPLGFTPRAREEQASRMGSPPSQMRSPPSQMGSPPSQRASPHWPDEPEPRGRR